MDFYLRAFSGRRSDTMTIEERITAIEKEVAELKEQVLAQPEKMAETLASNLKEAFAKMTGQR